MKNNNIPWIGEIPQDWEIVKIKALTSKVGSGKTPLGGAEVYTDSGVLFLRSQNIYETGLKLENSVYISEEIHKEMKTTKVCKNDVLLNITGASIGRCCIFSLDEEANVNQHVCIIRPNDNIHAGFLAYYWNSPSGQESINIFQEGANREGLNFNQISNTAISLPPLKTQQKIADFLDAKCSKIDLTIKQEKKQIAKLKEYRQSLITEAVTKGINPNVPMKDSGIKWIGEIPQGWEVSRIKNEFDNLDSLRQPVSSSERELGEYDYYGASGVIDKINSYIFDEPLLLIGEDGANLVMRNLPLIYKAIGKYWVNNHAHILRPKSSNYLEYWFYSLECNDLTNFISGSAQPKLTQENLANIPVVIPPLEEQKQIADYLDTKTAQIDNAIAKKETLITKLQEYKKSLIFEAVTGKMEV